MLRTMKSRMKIAVICAVVVSCATATACAGSSVSGESGGCRQDVRGVAGVIHPETSELRCAVINELIYAIPSEPQGYLVEGESPDLLWKCRLYAAKGHSVLLSCSHHQKHFSVVKDSS